MANPFDTVLEEETSVAKTANPFDDVLRDSNPFDEVVREPDYPTLPEYLRFKIGMDTANAARSRWGNMAMWGQVKDDEALRKGEEDFDYHKTKAGNFRDLSFKEAPFKYVAGETAQLLPYMFSSMTEGLKNGLILGGGFAGITAVAGQAGPQALLPEEVITVPTAFAGGMSTGFTYGIITNTLNREGGGMYLDFIKQGIKPETARPVALASGTLIGIIEMAQFKLIGAPFKQALSKVIKTDIGKKAIAGILTRYANRVSGELAEEELQEITQLIGETIAGAVDKNPNVIPTLDEWKIRLIQTAARAGAGLAVISAPGAAVDYASTVRGLKSVEKGVTQEQAELAETEKQAELAKKQPQAEAKEKFALPLAIRLKSGEIITDETAKLHSDIITKEGINPDEVADVGIMAKEGYQATKLPDEKGGAPLETLTEVPKEAMDKVRGLIKTAITPEKIKPDISGVAPLQRQIQSMEERQARVETAQDALEEINIIREYFRRRISKYKDAYLKEELTGIPIIYITKEGGIKPDEAMDELRTQFNIEVKDETELKEYLQNLEQSRKDLITEIKANKPELITKRETTLLAERIKATEQGLKEGRIQTKEEIEKTQTELIQMIEDAKLPLNERAKFLRTIKNIQTREDLAREFPEIAERLRQMKEKQIRSELVEEIKKAADRVKDSQAIAVEYADLIKDVVNQFELQGHKKETIAQLQATKDFIAKQVKAGKEVDMPTEILEKLEILQRKPLKEVTTQELEDLRDSIEELERLGRTKLRLRQMAYERKKAQDLEKLKTDSVPIIAKEKIRVRIGERLTETEKLKNKLTSIFNTLTKKKIVLTPMDAVIDELDGNKNYKGANFTIFKKTIDKHFSNWFDLSDKYTEKVVKLAEGMDEANFERIAVYATTQQEGGLEKLLSMGFTEEELKQIALTTKEQALLDEMRKQFDATWPEVSEIMRIVYNKPLGKVNYYFPFMTDYNAMTDFEIRDRFSNAPEHTRYLRKNVEMGFTKERVGGKQKIKLNAMEVFMRHIDNATYLMTVGKDIKYLNDLAAAEEYREAVGDVGQEIMREWLDLIARKGRLAGDRVPLLDAMRRYTGGVYLAFKLSSALVQFTSLFDGAALIGNYSFEGTQMITNKEIRNFLKENFPEWRKRIADDPAFMDFYKDDTILDKAIQLGISPLKLFDSLTAASVTIGAYKKYCIENGIKFDITKPNAEGINYAQLILRRTQASGLFKDIPLALSKGKLTGNISVDKTLLQFQSFLLNRWSLITHDLYKAGIKGKNKKQALNIAMWLILATVAETSMRQIVKRGTQAIKGEEPDEDKERTLAQEIFVNALQNIPFMGNAVSMFYYGSLGIPSIDWLNKAAGYSSAGFKSKTDEAKMRNFIKAGTLLLPGGSQIIQLFPKKEND